MRILRLALEAFGPFRDRFEVDFGSFEGDGVYLIAGPTGAGKSTVLDAISFATDNVFSDGTSLEMTSLSGNVTDGYVATISIAIAA